jgi:hypothetical protein
VREEVELLEDHADLAADGADVADIVGELDAVHHDLPALVFLEPVDGSDECRLAGPRWAKDHQHLAQLHGEVDAAKDVQLAEPLVNVAAHDDVAVGGAIGRSIGRCASCGARLTVRALLGSWLAHLPVLLFGAHRLPTPMAASSR